MDITRVRLITQCCIITSRNCLKGNGLRRGVFRCQPLNSKEVVVGPQLINKGLSVGGTHTQVGNRRLLHSSAGSDVCNPIKRITTNRVTSTVSELLRRSLDAVIRKCTSRKIGTYCLQVSQCCRRAGSITHCQNASNITDIRRDTT